MQVAYFINKKPITFTVSEDGTHSLPILSTTSKLEKKLLWKIFVIDNKIYRESWQDGGKVKTFKAIECFGKNIGRVNATTDSDQALFEAHSKWNKQHDKGYVVDGGSYTSSPVNKDGCANSSTLILPMLANKFEDRKKRVSYPVAVSYKIDGVRMVAVTNLDKTVKLTSRTGKEFSFMDKIRHHISTISDKCILDGELYSHTLPFNVISGATRSVKKKSEYDDKMEYWIFDIIDTEIEYKYRASTLQKMKKKYEKLFKPEERCLHFVLFEVAKNEDEVKTFHDKYVEQGYEGVMVRNMDGKYIMKNRSSDLLKYKAFEDSEFKIVGFKVGKGTEEGAIVYEVEHPESGLSFDVRPRGTIENRINLANKGNECIGKLLTVRYQKTGIDDGSLPRFPVGIDIRDYE